MSSPLPCYHCGLPVPAGSRFEARVLEQTRAFCCPGCQAVAEAIVAGGLESYYRHRSDNAINPQALPKALPDELALYDRDEVQQGFVEHQGEVSETRLLIEGISCAACGWLIEKHLRGLPGVVDASLNLSNQRLQVRWSDSQIPLSQLLAELRRIGYAGHPWQEDDASARLAEENRKAMRQIGVAGLLWMQVMMAAMATWPEFNVDLSPELDKILRWTSLFLTTPIVFYCCGQFFRGALRDLRTRHLTMDVSVSLAIGGAYVAGIWSTITGVGELYFDAVGMFALFLLAGAAHAQDKVRIGYISDMSSLYADLEGKGGATAIQMAIDDFGGKVLGKPIELLTVDHQNKADIAASKAREWIDTQNLTMIFSGTNSGVALALAKVA